MLLFCGGIIKMILICYKDYLFLGETFIQSIDENFWLEEFFLIKKIGFIVCVALG